MAAFKDWSLRKKMVVPAVLIAIVGSALLFVVVDRNQKSLVILQARQTARSISAQIQADRAVYTASVVGKLRKDGLAVKPGDRSQYPGEVGGIPLPASFVHETSELVNQKGLHTVDLLSLWNINPNKGPRNDQEREALEHLVTSPEGFREWVEGEGTDGFRYFQVTADIASAPSCVTCHNDLEQSPKRDFELDDVMGGLVVSLPLGSEINAARTNTYLWSGLLIGLLMTMMMVMVLIQWRYVSQPLIRLETAAERISKGDASEPVTALSDDEIGRLAMAFERMRQSIVKAMEMLARKT